MQIELEARHDAEVAAAAAQAPQQLLVGLDHDAVRRHELCTAEVVARQPVLALQPADAAAQRQTGDARGRDQAAGRGQPVGSRRRVEVRPRRTGLNDRAATFRVHLNAPQGSQVDDDTTLARRQAAHAVAARPHGKRHPGGAGQVYRSDDVGGAATVRDKRRLRRDGAVPHRPRLGVAVLTRHEYVAREARAKRHSEGLLRRRHASSLADESSDDEGGAAADGTLCRRITSKVCCHGTVGLLWRSRNGVTGQFRVTTGPNPSTSTRT